MFFSAAMIFAASGSLLQAAGVAPEAPTGLTVTETFMNSTWDRLTVALTYQDNSTDESGFVLERSDDGGPFQVVNTFAPNITGIYVKGPINVLSVFRVRAFNDAGYSDYTTCKPFVTVDGPTRLVLSAVSTNTVSVTWRDNAPQETGLKVTRSNDGGDTFQVVATLPRGSTNYIDTNLPLGVRYLYQVCAYTEKGDSWPSDTMDIAPGLAPEPPINVAAAVTYTPPATTARDVMISFKDTAITELGFHIYRSTNGTDWQLISTLPTTSVANRAYTDAGLSPGTTYYYRIASFNLIGDSEYVNRTVTIPNLPPAGVTTLYVSDESAGENDGSSWGNAWALNSINWAGVKPGMTIVLSGGPVGGVREYGMGLSVGASGTSNSPIVIQTAKDSEHGGRVKLLGVDFGTRSWVTLDGSKDASFTASKAAEVPGNINLEITNPGGPAIYASGTPIGIHVRWAECHHTGAGHGIWFNATGGYMADIEVAYCHVHDNWQDGINASQGGQARYGVNAIHHNIIEGNGDDGIQWPSGVDIHHNIIRKRQLGLGNGHPDGIQGTQGYYRIYNNEVSDFSNGCIFIETWGQIAGNILVYNNVFFTGELTNSLLRAININATALGSSSNSWDVVNWDEILIANNVMYNLPNYAAVELSAAADVARLKATNVRIQNNIIYQCMTASPNGVPVIVGPEGTTSDIIFDNNIVAGANTRIAYGGQLFENATSLNLSTGFAHNSSAAPVFANYLAGNVRLSGADTAARGHGANLSFLKGLAPSIGEDADGVIRSATSAWDIGAFQTSGIVAQKPTGPSNLRIR